MKKIKILMDVNSIVVPTGRKYLSGIGRTTLELLHALQQIRELPIDLCLYTQRLPDSGIDDYDFHFKKLYIPLPGDSISKLWVAKLHLKEILNHYDLYHIPHNFDATADASKTVVTIHDALYFSYPEAFLGHHFAREYYPRLAKTCRSIVTCSQASKSDIVHYMKIAPEKITVIPWGVSAAVFHPERNMDDTKMVLNEKGLLRPYFVMVSCDIGRKNTIALLRAFKIYLYDKNGEHDLVLVWNNPPKEYLEEFSHEIQSGRIHFLNNVDDTLLRKLYNGATASFFPSRYEGFGLPVLESMACGTPVVTCENSSLKEAGGEAALYTRPDDLEHMAQFMFDFEHKNLDRQLLSERSIKHASDYTWKHTATEYLKFYQRAAEE